MSKRNAGKQLTDQNWEDDEETEDPGIFTAAKEDVLKSRQIKSAKRRVPNTEGGSGAFKGFSGFGAKPSDTPAPVFNFGTSKALPGLGTVSNGDKSGFGAKAKEDGKEAESAGSGFKFVSPVTEADAPKSGSNFTFGTAVKTSDEKKIPSGFSFGSAASGSRNISSGFTLTSNLTSDGNKLSTTSDTAASAKFKPAVFGDKNPKKSGSSNNAQYLTQLKGLNEAVARWIKEHVDKNPYILLTPIFTDYQKYVDEIEKDNPDNKSTSETKTLPTNIATSDSGKAATPVGFSFGVAKKSEDKSESSKPEENAPNSLFSFGASAASTKFASFSSSASTNFTGFGFKAKTDGVESKSLFSTANTGESKPFSFATGAAVANSGKKEEEEEEYVPPQPETVEVKEDDALYTKRCKMFYQKDGAWKERGVGNLHLKPLNDKTQLLVRADNTLGTVLLNIVLSTAIPMKRQGKNNVSLFCPPNPPLDPKMDADKPVSMLLRVKTGDDADELLQQLDKYKS